MNAVEECKQAGYDVLDDNGVIIMLMNPDDFFTDSRRVKEVRKFKKLLKSIGYIRSWGYRPKREDAKNIDDRYKREAKSDSEYY